MHHPHRPKDAPDGAKETKMKRWCGGGCGRDLNRLPIEDIHDKHVGMCLPCGEEHDDRLFDEAWEDAVSEAGERGEEVL